MHQDLDDLEAELAAAPDYAAQFRAVFSTGVDRDGIAKALAAYQRSLITEPSPFDRYLSGDKNALSNAAQRGLELFVGEAGCVRCHNGPLLSDGKFYRLGVGFKDKGLGAVTGKSEDNYKFRTPSLRNIAETSPYMHDGSMETLADVVTFYFREIPTAPGNLPLDVEALSAQSFSDIDYLVAFLKSLTGKPPVNAK
jgi:cytochrome c peroxidase